MTRLTDGEEHRYFQSGASLAFSYVLNDKLSWFTEYYELCPSTRDRDCQHNIDFGPVILVNPDIQIDIRGGRASSAGTGQDSLGAVVPIPPRDAPRFCPQCGFPLLRRKTNERNVELSG